MTRDGENKKLLSAYMDDLTRLEDEVKRVAKPSPEHFKLRQRVDTTLTQIEAVLLQLGGGEMVEIPAKLWCYLVRDSGKHGQKSGKHGRTSDTDDDGPVSRLGREEEMCAWEEVGSRLRMPVGSQELKKWVMKRTISKILLGETKRFCPGAEEKYCIAIYKRPKPRKTGRIRSSSSNHSPGIST